MYRERLSGVPWEINRFHLIGPKKHYSVTANNKSLLSVCVVVTGRAIKYSSTRWQQAADDLVNLVNQRQ